MFSLLIKSINTILFESSDSDSHLDDVLLLEVLNPNRNENSAEFYGDFMKIYLKKNVIFHY